jgi:hypothetical protein
MVDKNTLDNPLFPPRHITQPPRTPKMEDPHPCRACDERAKEYEVAVEIVTSPDQPPTHQHDAILMTLWLTAGIVLFNLWLHYLSNTHNIWEGIAVLFMMISWALAGMHAGGAVPLCPFVFFLLCGLSAYVIWFLSVADANNPWEGFVVSLCMIAWYKAGEVASEELKK